MGPREALRLSKKGGEAGRGKTSSFIRGNLLVLIVSWIFFNFASSLVFPYEALFIRELGASALIIGVLNALGQVLLLFSRIVGGYMADKYGRRDLIAWMTYGVALSYLFYVFAPDWRLLVVGVIMHNICLLYQPALSAITAESIPPEKRGLGYALTNVLPSIPALFAPLLARELVNRFGFLRGVRLAYSIVVICGALAADVRLIYLKETLETGARARARELLSEVKRSFVEMKNAWLLMPKQLKMVTVMLLISAFEEPLFHLFLSFYAVDVVGISEADWALMAVAWSSVSLLVGIPLGRAVDAVGRKNALVLAYAIWLPPSLYLLFCRSFSELLIIMVLFALGGALFVPAIQALQADLSPKEARGRIMSLVGNLNLVAASISSAVAGALYDMDPTFPFITALALGFASFSIILFFVKEPEERYE
ncbi:MAG TPA: MFS transporter [Candidatus Bathyarchaeota archaeon]|nr:MFS transporter [Candidatus Bathyarchaeota archaeon]